MTLHDKTVFLLLPGSSINELHQFMPIENVLWATLNRFTPIQRDFLKPYRKEIDLLWCSSNCRFNEEYYNIQIYLNSGKFFYTTHEMYLKHNDLFSNYPGQIFCSSEGQGMCSLFTFLAILIKQNVKKIILVGADGKADIKVYYNDNEIIDENFYDRRKTILRDTEILNKIFWDCINVWYPPYVTEIINVNKNSAYTIFKYKSLKEVIHDLT